MKKSIRIGLLLGTKKSKNDARILLKMAIGIKKSGGNVVILCPDDHFIAKSAASKEIPVQHIREFKKSYDFAGALAFRKALKKSKIDTILFRDHRETAILVTSKFLLKGKLRLIYCQSEALAQMKRDFLHTFRFNQLDAWITPYSATALEVKSETNLDHDRLHVLPIPFSLKKRIPKRNTSRIESKANFRIGYIFNNERFDEANQLFEAVRILIEKDSRIELLVSFDGGKVNEQQFKLKLSEELVRCGLTDSFNLINLDQSEIPFWSECDAIFIGLYSEPFTGVCERAMAYSIPCIAFSSLLSRDVFADGHAAVLCKRDNVEDLALSIERVMGDEELRYEVVANARELSRKDLSVKVFSEHMINLLKALPKK